MKKPKKRLKMKSGVAGARFPSIEHKPGGGDGRQSRGRQRGGHHRRRNQPCTYPTRCQRQGLWGKKDAQMNSLRMIAPAKGKIMDTIPATQQHKTEKIKTF
jgi:hypothetical protein